MLLLFAHRGRLRHGRHFTYKSTQNDLAITLVTSAVAGTLCDERRPFAAHGPWLQVLLTDDQIHRLLRDLQHLAQPNLVVSPIEVRCPFLKRMLPYLSSVSSSPRLAIVTILPFFIVFSRAV